MKRIRVVNSVPDGNDRREKDQESENADVPLSSEAVYSNENEWQSESDGTEDLMDMTWAYKLVVIFF